MVNPLVPEFNDKMGSEVEEDTAAEMSSQAEYADGEQEPDDAEQPDDNSENSQDKPKAQLAIEEKEAEHARVWRETCRHRKRRHNTERAKKRQRTSTGTCVKPLAEMDYEFHDEWDSQRDDNEEAEEREQEESEEEDEPEEEYANDDDEETETTSTDRLLSEVIDALEGDLKEEEEAEMWGRKTQKSPDHDEDEQRHSTQRTSFAFLLRGKGHYQRSKQ